MPRPIQPNVPRVRLNTPAGRGLIIENDSRKRMQCNVDDMGTQYGTMLDNFTQFVALQHAVIETSIFQFFCYTDFIDLCSSF